MERSLVLWRLERFTDVFCINNVTRKRREGSRTPEYEERKKRGGNTTQRERERVKEGTDEGIVISGCRKRWKACSEAGTLLLFPTTQALSHSLTLY